MDARWWCRNKGAVVTSSRSSWWVSLTPPARPASRPLAERWCCGGGCCRSRSLHRDMRSTKGKDELAQGVGLLQSAPALLCCIMQHDQGLAEAAAVGDSCSTASARSKLSQFCRLDDLAWLVYRGQLLTGLSIRHLTKECCLGHDVCVLSNAADGVSTIPLSSASTRAK